MTSRRQLERLLSEGVRSGEPMPADAKFWKNKRRKVSGTRQPNLLA